MFLITLVDAAPPYNLRVSVGDATTISDLSASILSYTGAEPNAYVSEQGTLLEASSSFYNLGITANDRIYCIWKSSHDDVFEKCV